MTLTCTRVSGLGSALLPPLSYVLLTASLPLAALVAQTKGITFSNQQTSGACRGERVSLVRQPDSVYDVNCLDVRLALGRFLLSHIQAPIAARLFPLRCDVQVEMYSRLRFPSHVRIIIK